VPVIRPTACQPSPSGGICRPSGRSAVVARSITSACAGEAIWRNEEAGLLNFCRFGPLAPPAGLSIAFISPHWSWCRALLMVKVVQSACALVRRQKPAQGVSRQPGPLPRVSVPGQRPARAGVVPSESLGCLRASPRHRTHCGRGRNTFDPPLVLEVSLAGAVTSSPICELQVLSWV
jgi:hypothetical protein